MQRQTPAGTPSPTGTSLRAYLMAYALLSLLPVLGFGAWAVAHYSTAERQSTGQTARWYARELSNNVEHELRRVADQLNRISASRALLAGELATVHERAAQASATFKASIVIRDASGQQVLNTAVPWGTPLPDTALPRQASDVLAKGNPYVSDLHVGAVKQRPIVTVTVPVMKDGHLAQSISMSLEPAQILASLGVPLPPDGWIAGVADRDLNIIVSTINQEGLLGTPSPPIVARGTNTPQAGVDEITTPSGLRVLRAWQRSELSGWTTAVKMPIERLEGPFRLRWQALAGVGCLLLALSSLLAWVMSGRLITQSRMVAAQASALVGGGPPPMARSSLREANEILISLDTARQKLAERERELRAKAAEIETMFEGSPVGMFRANMNKELTHANARLCEMSNISMDNLHGTGWLQSIPAEQRAEALARWDAAIAEHKPFELEVHAVSVKRGLGDQYFHIHAIPEFDTNQTQIGFIGTVIDSSDRMRAEVAKFAEMSRFKRMLLATPDIVYIHDVGKSEFSFLNRTLEEALGLEDTDGVGAEIGFARLAELIHPDDWANVDTHRHAMRSARDGEVRQVEARIVRPADGHQTWFLIRTVVFTRNLDGSVQQILGIASDVTERKRAEAAESAEIDRFKRMLLATPDIVYVHDVRHDVFSFLNRSLREALGLDVPDNTAINYAGIVELVDPEDRDRLETHSRSMLAARDGEVLAVEVRIRRPDMEQNAPAPWLLVRNVVFARTADGKLDQVLGIATDITERKRAEALRLEENERFKRMALASPDVVFLFDLQTSTWNQLNRSLASTLGYGILAGEANGSSPNLFELVFADDHPRLGQHIQDMRTCGDGETKTVEFRARALDGGTRWFLNRSVVVDRSPDGSVRQILGNAADITARKMAEMHANEEIERFKSMAVAHPDVVYLYDHEAKKITFLNRGLRGALGYPATDNPSPGAEELYDLIFDEDVDKAHAHIRATRAARDGEVLMAEGRFRAPDGGTRWLLNRSVVYSRQPDGRVRQVMCIASDITDQVLKRDLLEAQVAVEVERREMAQMELARANSLEAIGRLTGGVAHDFSNLLTVIMASLHLLKDEPMSDEARQRVRDALEGSNTARRITRQLLSFARRQRLDPSAVELGKHLAATVHWIETTLGHGYEVRSSFPETTGIVVVDEAALDTAVVNLMLNARDAMPDGGVLTIETGNIHMAKALEDGSPAGEHVFLSITDTGTGMTPEVAKRAMEPFFTTKGRVGRGTGLGMSSVYGFVKQSMGRIEILSQPGQGTCVVMYFPRAEGAVIKPASATDGWDVAEGRGETLLVVDDMTLVREVLARWIGKLGYRTVTADSGEAARVMIEASQKRNGPPIDIVLSDIIMPGGMSGYDLAHWIEDNAPRLPVVLMSGNDEGAQAASTDAQGAVRRPLLRIAKPFSAQEITRALRQAMEGNRTSE